MRKLEAITDLPWFELKVELFFAVFAQSHVTASLV